MKTDAAALIDILINEKESYQDLLELSRKEQELIIKGDVEGLSAIVKETEHLISTILDLQKKRLSLMGMDAGFDLPSLPLEFSPIVNILDKPTAERASELKDAMLSIIKDLTEINRTNAELLKRSMSYIDFLLNEITREESPIYSNNPNPRRPSPRLFEGKA